MHRESLRRMERYLGVRDSGHLHRETGLWYVNVAPGNAAGRWAAGGKCGKRVGGVGAYGRCWGG